MGTAHIGNKRGHLLRGDKTLEKRCGTHGAEKFLLEFRKGFPSAEFCDESIHTDCVGWSRQNRVAGHFRSGTGFGNPARDRQEGSFCHPVMNHLTWDLDAAL